MNLSRLSRWILFAAGFLIFCPHLGAQGLSAAAHHANACSPDLAIVHLEKDIPDLMSQADVPGLSIAVLRNGRTAWLHNFGIKNTKTEEPVIDATIFEAASLSKPVFAYAVLKLVDQGKLGLDVPLSTYLPKPYIERDDRLAKITARIVLSHRTGFRNWRGDGNPLSIYFTPGERFSYSGEGFIYLQRVVEQVEGKPLNDIMTQLVFTPLGMASSSYVWRADFDERTATGHDGDATPQELWKPKDAGAASTLNTTAHDYALFVAAILNGAGLKPATLHEMETPQIAVDPECTNCTDRTPKQLSKNIFWGLGWASFATASPKRSGTGVTMAPSNASLSPILPTNQEWSCSPTAKTASPSRQPLSAKQPAANPSSFRGSNMTLTTPTPCASPKPPAIRESKPRLNNSMPLSKTAPSLKIPSTPSATAFSVKSASPKKTASSS